MPVAQCRSQGWTDIQSRQVDQPVVEIETIASDEEVIEKSESDFADVTSVRDDRRPEIQSPEGRNHESNPVDSSQSDFDDVTLVSDDDVQEEQPVENQLPCGSCGSYNHSSQRASRRKFYPAWNKSCESCNKRGHFKNVCRITSAAEHVDEFDVVVV